MKSNDDIPQDEMLLAEAIAVAKARGLGWCAGQRFHPDAKRPEIATACCAMGALEIAGVFERFDNRMPIELMDVWRGNDDTSGGHWPISDVEHGESLGHAFRCAMTQEEP